MKTPATGLLVTASALATEAAGMDFLRLGFTHIVPHGLDHVVFVLGLGMILLGVVLMFIMRAKAPAFFQGKTLNRDTETLIIPE